LHALLYHDVIDGSDPDSSGLTGAGAALYKLDALAFERHLDAIARAVSEPPATLAPPQADPPAHHWLLTFDDGGRSALQPTADLLDRRGWPGHFFVTAGRIGTRGFLSPEDILELRARGHVVGSHSWSHPARFSALSSRQMLDEWDRSIERLSSILGEAVTSASVPGGYYSHAVARAAERAGITTLFTSEPVSRARRVDGCTVLGRFSIQRHTPPARAAALALGRAAPCTAQWLAWNARKAAKRVAGDFYVTAREALLARHHVR
jgi:peptidoglycan/xylan/chitin deacetylase (PgdA/CDA1 family)